MESPYNDIKSKKLSDQLQSPIPKFTSPKKQCGNVRKSGEKCTNKLKLGYSICGSCGKTRSLMLSVLTGILVREHSLESKEKLCIHHYRAQELCYQARGVCNQIERATRKRHRNWPVYSRED